MRPRGGGAGYPLEAHPERACVPEYSHSHSHSRIHSQPCCKIYMYEKRSHARKINVFWRRTPRFCVGAVCARLVVRDAGWEQACVRSFARVFCVSQERWVVDGADRQQVRNTLNVHDSGLQAALSFTWRCIVGNGGSSSLSEDDSTRSRTNFQQAQSAAAQLANAWRKHQCFVVKKKLWESFFWGFRLEKNSCELLSIGAFRPHLQFGKFGAKPAVKQNPEDVLSISSTYKIKWNQVFGGHA